MSVSYRIRYRAKNFNGWGSFSEINYILAACKPNKPYAPVYVSSTASTITFALIMPENQSGSPITQYKLYADTMGLAADYQLVYAGSSNSIQVGTSDGLVSGYNYRFVLVTSNVFGDSLQSEETRVALGRLPTKPD